MAIKSFLTNMSDGGVSANGSAAKKKSQTNYVPYVTTGNSAAATKAATAAPGLLSKLADTISKVVGSIDVGPGVGVSILPQVPYTGSNTSSSAKPAQNQQVIDRVKAEADAALKGNNPSSFDSAPSKALLSNLTYGLIDAPQKAEQAKVLNGTNNLRANGYPSSVNPTSQPSLSALDYNRNKVPQQPTLPPTTYNDYGTVVPGLNYDGAGNTDASGIYYKDAVSNLLSELSNVITSGRNNYESIYNDLLAGALNTEKAYKEYETAGRNRDADIKANSIENLMKALRLNERSGVHSNSNRGATLANNVQLTNSALQDDNAELSANELERMNKALELSKLINTDTRTSAMNYTNSQLSSIMNVLANYLYGDVASINNANATKYAAYTDYASQLAQLSAMQNYYDSQAALNNVQASLYGSNNYLDLLNAYTNSYNKG